MSPECGGCSLSGGEEHFALHFLILHWVLDTWSLRVSIARMRYHDKEQRGEERLYLSAQLSGHSPSLREVRAEIQDRNGRGDHREALLTGLFPMACSACSLKPSRTTCQGVVLPPVGWMVPHQLLTKKMPYRFVHKPILCMHFLNKIFSSQIGLGLYQVDKKPTRTWS